MNRFQSNINVGSRGKIASTDSYKFLINSIKYSEITGLTNIIMLLNNNDKEYLDKEGYEYNLVNDPNYDNVYNIKMK